MTSELQSLRALVEARGKATPREWETCTISHGDGEEAAAVTGFRPKFEDAANDSIMTEFTIAEAESSDLEADADMYFIADAAHWTATQAPALITKIERDAATIERMREALEAIIADFNGGEHPEKKLLGDHEYISPSSSMLKSTLILNAIEALKG